MVNDRDLFWEVPITIGIYGYEKFWLREWPLKPQKGIFEWVVFTNEKYLQNMVKVDLKVQFKISVMKKFENQKHKA